jgi:dTDP-4-dehydrorhamnose 3,5-epimerase
MISKLSRKNLRLGCAKSRFNGKHDMQLIATHISDVKILQPERITDSRGFFSEVWNARGWAATGVDAAFVQDNHAHNPAKGTLRGLHYQLPPKAQGKLLRVTRGAAFDVAVDVRSSSPTFGSQVSVILSAENWRQLWVPPGFAHGYCTLEDDTEVLYKVTDFYSPDHDRGLAWDDPALAIEWPFPAEALVISERDRQLPRLSDQPDLLS